MKKNIVKRIICFTVMCIVLISSFSFIVSAQEVMPCYNNVVSAESSVTISSSGMMEITNSFLGSTSVFSKAVITTYVEKRFLGIFWTKVDIGQTNDEWIDTIYTNVYSGTHSVQLPSTGTYRTTVEYVIYGSGGSADTITKEIEKSY